jgi:mono/diheme cytochrome c family protein
MCRSKQPLVALLLGCLVALIGCQRMAQEPRYRPLQSSTFFADGTSARPIPGDTVARGRVQDDTLLYAGKDASGQDSAELPFPASSELLLRGKQRYEIYCAVCHGFTGDGDGMVVQRGFLPPPSYHSDRLRQAPVGHFFDVITNGFGAMPSYADQIPVTDRWAIVAYVRALQLSQHAGLNDVPADERTALERQQ